MKDFLFLISSIDGPKNLKYFGTNFFLTGIAVVSKNLRAELSKRVDHVLALPTKPTFFNFKIFK